MFCRLKEKTKTPYILKGSEYDTIEQDFCIILCVETELRTKFTTLREWEHFEKVLNIDP